jgi:hypothetical protein
MKAALLLTTALISPAAQAQTPTSSGVYHLTACLDSHYGAGNWTQRTSIGVGTDIGPALSDCVTAIRNTTGRGRIYIDPGIWLLTTSPPTFTGIQLEGYGSQASVVVYNSGAGIAFPYINTKSNGCLDGGGMRGIAILLEKGFGTSNAYAIVLSGDTSCQPDQTLWEDLYVTSVAGASYWWETFHADGSARTKPQGIRGGSMHNIQLFNAHHVGLYMANAVQWDLVNVGIYTGIGTGKDVWLYGAGTRSTNSVHINAIGLNYAGKLHLACSDGHVNYTRVC